ncbi:MAG: hypothetical protein CMG71_07170 [Candidatus Marinimicrobia bacterium]|nr:hypothetical protein [Candidatus Neomarinimicrobiota bacterium]|tara:strand:+ start:1673 stop:2779 length:1107 start_codon:yes stop_codon:yes gene_type:complete
MIKKLYPYWGFLFLAVMLPALVNGKDYYIYATAESEDEVALIKFDGKKAHVEKRIPVGVWPVEIEGPHGINISPDGEYWYLSMAHGIPFGHLYKYKTGTDEMVDRVELGLFPATLQVSHATGLLYVVNFNLHGGHDEVSTVSIVDPEEMIEIERVETGIMPHGSRLSNSGLKHYSVAMMSAELYELDAMQMSVTRKLSTGKKHQMMKGMQHHTMNKMGKHSMPKEKPTWVYPHPNDQFLYVVNNGTDEVVEVDIGKWMISRRFATDKGPYNCEVSPDGQQLVVTYKTAAKTGIWDIKSGKELGRIKNTRKVSHGVVISPDSRFAFVSVEGIGAEPGSVDVIDLVSMKLVDQADIGKQAGGIAFWKMEN